MTDLAGRPAALATELLRHGARFVVVGSTARRLTTGEGTPHDLDVTVCRGDLPRLAAALAGLGVTTTVERLGREGQSHVDTSWGPLDVFVDDDVAARELAYVRGGRTWTLEVVAP
ncbi:hypothetical protein GCM10023258_02850 [Terrabacter aeriphilus]|uniref:Nucleotidyltransferase-like protein n=1 Tax=Terrabacter aeriphilus TaxID=515662 RepID=A0ABP9J2J7_9MICO